MSTAARYTPILRRLHWLIAVLLLVAYVAIEQRGLFERGTPERAAMMQTHFWIGLSIFALALWRVVQRFKTDAPPITPALPGWQAGLAKVMHIALYAFILLMPVFGLCTAWADGKQLLLPFTDIALPSLIAADPELGHQLEDWHGQIGEIFYWVIGLHVLAALFHHWVKKDDTLKRML